MAHHKLLVLMFFLALSITALGQPAGFLSIDCGKPAGTNYTDTTTGIRYVSDSGYIDTGVNHQVQDSYQSSGQYQQVFDLRSFPNGTRNCYTLPVVDGSRYLVRAFFMYGNYDGQNRLPRFDLYVDMFSCGIIEPRNASINYYTEIVVMASSDHMSVCLINTGNGETFISALELRLLPSGMYEEANASLALNILHRDDFGSASDDVVYRYPTDAYDRLWTPFYLPGWTKINTANQVKVNNSFKPPPDIMATAVIPTNGTTLNFKLSGLYSTSMFHIFLHFAELQTLSSTQIRKFNISLNGRDFYSLFQPDYLSITTILTIKPESHDSFDFSIFRAEGSNLPPLINALEIYSIALPIAQGTDVGDVDAIMGVKRFYNLVERNWMGDPCDPKEYLWDGLNCTYETNQSSRINSLVLSSSGLVGVISPSIANLTELQHLDLSMNNLSGAIPDFLGSLSNMVYLNLTGNNFSGAVPKSLLDRAARGELTLSVQNQSSSLSNPIIDNGNKKSNVWKIIVGIVAGIFVIALLLLLVYFTVIKPKRDQQKQSGQIQNPGIANQAPRKVPVQLSSFRAESRQFTYLELTTMTNNFSKVLGGGGFGIVYYGKLENGKPVAVKKLSRSSAQGPKEFNAEAQLLTRIHHKNLVSLVGYCKDQDNMLLVYEYMANGNLSSHLSNASDESESQISSTISWRERIRIGMEAAQGLEYLHNGCDPPIIHRDIKPSNILLSRDMDVKIADFGLSRICHTNKEKDFVSTAIMGTPGYLDPEYSTNNRLNDKSDVYSFGIVLLELITGKPAIMKIGNLTNIVTWIEPLIELADLNQIVDPKLQGDYNPHSVWKALEVAMACVAKFSIQRPPMNDVLALLKEAMKLELAPRMQKDGKIQPGFETVGSGSMKTFSIEFNPNLEPHAR